MGYSTMFLGRFRITPPLTGSQRDYLRAFSDTRRVTRDPARLLNARDPLRQAAGLPLGAEGCYFVGPDTSQLRQRHPRSILDDNRPPASQPGLWCQWAPDERGAFLSWDGAEKFYNYLEWLEYLIEHFLKPWGRSVSGDVRWQGDDDADIGTIKIRANVIDVLGPVVVRQGKHERRLRVFLCHASEDKRQVRSLARRLVDDNIDAWLDEARLLPGSDWSRAIHQALRTSDAVVLCLSAVSVRKRGFVQREVRVAQEVAAEEPEGALFLFPVRLSACEVPDSLRHLQRIDLKRRGAYASLLAGFAARADFLTAGASRHPRKRSNTGVKRTRVARR